MVPLAYHIQGLYRLRRGRTRLDDFFSVLVGSTLAVVLGIVATLYIQAYYVPDALKDRGAFEVSQLVWGLFLVLNVLLTYGSREVVRQTLERRWRAGLGLKQVLIAGRWGPRAAGRRQDPRAPRAGLPGRRDSSTTARSAITSGTAACPSSGPCRTPPRSSSAKASISSTSPCPSTST